MKLHPDRLADRLRVNLATMTVCVYHVELPSDCVEQPAQSDAT